MRPIKNKKRIDPRYFLDETTNREEETIQDVSPGQAAKATINFGCCKVKTAAEAMRSGRKPKKCDFAVTQEEYDECCAKSPSDCKDDC